MDQHAQVQQPWAPTGKDGNEQGNNSAVESSAAADCTSTHPDLGGPEIGSEEPRPALPPRPNTLNLLDESMGSPKAARQAKATTAVSLTDINTQADGSKDTRSVPGSLRARASLSQVASSRASEAGDSTSVRSSVVNHDAGEMENLLNDFLATETEGAHQGSTGLLQFPEFRADDVEDDFAGEFESVGEIDENQANEELILEKWKSKRKHYLIFSAAGKPIWTRHGDGGLISTYVGVIQTIISFFEDAKDPLQTFTAGDAKFVVLTKGPVYLVAISQLLETETQLKLQLEAFYMQILSTLTYPSLTHLFSVRPSTDLKRPLQGTESLLSTLADSFTKGSPSTLLSALECLKIRKAHRQTINNALLKTKASSLLYGLVVAGGRLVSVVRPKKHSLHPGDLQLLFNMIFEAEGVKAGGGESWIPVCLPGFNNSGYLYMYVSFLDLRDETSNAPDEDTTKEESVAIILISANKESFFELQEMRNSLVEQLEKTNSIKIIKDAVDKGRPSTTDIVPGTVLHHFLYKSKPNVQFAMSSFDPDFSSISKRRRLMSTYNNLHASIHAKHTHVRVHHCVSHSASSFAWVTPMFELYSIASPNANRNALAQSASKIVQWVRQEEERLFIIGGAVF